MTQQLYLAAPQANSDFSRFVVYPYDAKCSIWITEGKAIQIDGGYRLLLKVAHCAQEYRSKEVDGKPLTFESQPYAFFDIHSKEWTNKGFGGKPDTTVQPTDIELYLCGFFDENEALRNGFKGEIHFADYASLIDLAGAGSIDMSVVSGKMAKLEPTTLSEEFKAKKEPPVYGAKGTGKGTYTAKSEGDKAKERAEFIRAFLDPTNADGFFSGKFDDAVTCIYGKDAPIGYLESFIRLILP